MKDELPNDDGRRLRGYSLLDNRYVQSFNHRIVIKAESSRLIPRKLAANLELLVSVIVYNFARFLLCGFEFKPFRNRKIKWKHQ